MRKLRYIPDNVLFSHEFYIEGKILVSVRQYEYPIRSLLSLIEFEIM